MRDRSFYGDGKQRIDYEMLFLEHVHAGEFEIDEWGDIWRLQSTYNSRVRATERRRAETDIGHGNLTINFSHDGVALRANPSRVLYAYHKGAIPPGLVVIHTNGVHEDRRIENLEAVTGQLAAWLAIWRTKQPQQQRVALLSHHRSKKAKNARRAKKAHAAKKRRAG